MERIPQRLRRAQLERMHLPRFGQTEPRAVLPRQRHLLRQARAARRGLWLAVLTLPSLLVQACLLLLPGRAKVAFARGYWMLATRAIGVQVRVVGRAAGGGGRPVLYVSNHSSWLDIPVLGGVLPACFVSKDDVAAWPVIGTVARLGRTVFVSRNRGNTGRERDAMRERLAAGDDLVLFPEGTSSDGSRVLPFRSAFFDAAYGDVKPLIQPVSVVYDRLAGLPVSHASRTVFAWYGDMSLAPHFWQLAQWRGKRVTVLLHRPIDPADFPTRKALAQAAWQAVADGAAALRQNRPARPLPVAEPEIVGEPVFA